MHKSASCSNRLVKLLNHAAVRANQKLSLSEMNAPLREINNHVGCNKRSALRLIYGHHTYGAMPVGYCTLRELAELDAMFMREKGIETSRLIPNITEGTKSPWTRI